MQTILLVDDDDDFVFLVDRAIERSRLQASLQWVWDGEQAISYLSRRGRFKDEAAFPAPSLVLLDLKMRRLNGFDVLKWRSDHPEFSKMPFVILSSSNLDSDKKRAAELGARHYFVKPMNLTGLVEIVEQLETFCSGEE